MSVTTNGHSLDLTDEDRAKIAQHNAGTHLLRLPLELRQQIWTLVLGGRCICLHYDMEEGIMYRHIEDGPFNLQKLTKALELWTKGFTGDLVLLSGASLLRRKDRDTAAYNRNSGPGPQLDLLYTCHSIKAETNPLLFSTNVFEFANANAMAAFMKVVLRAPHGVGASNLATVRYIRILEPHFGGFKPWERVRKQVGRRFTGVRIFHLHLDVASKVEQYHRLEEYRKYTGKDAAELVELAGIAYELYGQCWANPKQKTSRVGLSFEGSLWTAEYSADGCVKPITKTDILWP